MTTAMMEDWVMRMYPTKEWIVRVNRMPIEQIVAIYYSDQERRRKKAIREAQERENAKHYHQITLEEYFK